MRQMMSRCRLLVLSVGVLIAGVDGAAACGSGKLLFEDKFETIDPAWNLPREDATRSNGPGGLVYKLGPGDSIITLNQSGLHENYEVCAVFTSEVPAEADAYVAVDFWGSDSDNVYEADIYPAFGTYSVYRYQNKKALKPISPRSDDSVVKGTSATNEISITVNGNKATIALNGKKVIDFTGQPPEGGSLFGLSLGTLKGDAGPSTFTVKSIQLREVATSQP
jgi:hypothetical protein